MKKFAIAALAAMVAVVSFSTVADARNRDDQWRHHQGRDHGDRNDRNWRDRGWRHEGWRHDGWRHNGWRYGWRAHGWRNGYWGGPSIVIAPGYDDYCFVKKVRDFDRDGNVYIKRIRVCR